MNRPEQTVHILAGGMWYSFDAVIQAEHRHGMDVLEDYESAEKKTHINYAVRKPSEITLEVSVTDTVTIYDEPLTEGASSRSASAYSNLYRLMQERELLTVITRMHTFNDMLISDFVVTEDPEHQFEMYANVGFKEMTVVAPAPESTENDNKHDKPQSDEGTEKVSILTGFTQFASNVWGWLMGRGD